MQEVEYVKLLLDSSFKGSERFWTRNNSFFFVQSIVIGFALNALVKGINQNIKLFFFIFSFIGMFFALFHFLVLRISAYYNTAWFCSMKNVINKLAEDPNSYNQFIWKHFSNHLCGHEIKLPWPRLHSTRLAYCIPIMFFLMWLVIFIALALNWFPINASDPKAQFLILDNINKIFYLANF